LKKAGALFLVVLFSFNLFGYLLVIEYLQHRASQELETALDNHLYDDSRLVEIKMAINLPYQTDRSLYERYDGEMEIGGTLYKFVKRKLTGDTLYLICIPHTKKMHLEKVRNNYFALSNDLAQDKTKNSATARLLFKNFQTDFEAHSFYPDAFLITAENANSWAEKQSVRLPSSPSVSPEHPPDPVS
jgi:hypothetical protein